MDISINAVRKSSPATHSPENGAAGPNAADVEAAARRKWYQDAYIKERDNVAVNHLSPERMKTLEAHISLMHRLDDALAGKPSPFSPLKTELDKINEMKTLYVKLLQDETDHYRTSWKTWGWNLVAGGNAFLLCFGLGTILSNAMGKPWLALVISPIVWSLTERLIPMIRATSWRNRHADVDYPHIMRISARAVHDQVRQMFGLHAKKYLVDGKTLTASQYRQILSLFNEWKGKVATDDLPYFFYTFWYSVRTIILYLCTTPAFLNTTGGTVVSLVSLGVAGILAGASTSVTVQAARRHAHKKENPDTWRNGEILVKAPKVWRAERQVLEAKFDLMDAYLGKAPDKNNHGPVEVARAALGIEIFKAGMKSERLTSIAYEISRLAQEKSEAGEDGFSEAAGNRIDFLCGLLGKTACLLPAVLFNQLVATRYTSSEFDLATRLSVALFLNTLLIMGFSFRKELEFPGRYMIALVHACSDALNDSRGIKDKYADNDVDAALAVSVTTYLDSGVESENEVVSPTNGNTVAPRRLFQTDQTNPDGASASDEASSERV